MINSIDDLKSVEIREMKPLCAQLDPDVFTIAMHGVTPSLVKKFGTAMPLIRNCKVRLSHRQRQ